MYKYNYINIVICNEPACTVHAHTLPCRRRHHRHQRSTEIALFGLGAAFLTAGRCLEQARRLHVECDDAEGTTLPTDHQRGLATTSSLERFNGYLYDMLFYVETDHKPLVIRLSSKKNLHAHSTFPHSFDEVFLYDRACSGERADHSRRSF